MLKQLVVAAALLVVAVPALAQTPGAPPASSTPPAEKSERHAARDAMREACAADVASFCKDVEPGGGKLRECLHYNREHLSPGCLAAWQKLRAVRGYTRGQTPEN
jgi:hypothetical protein